MSHSKERKEKICLNCKADLYGRYCHSCGQENIEPKETVWGLISHFFYDITHFDGKFFSTSKYLIFRPGFLPKEYEQGRRARYLHPIRMYVFSSALFFLFLFSMFNVKDMDWGNDENEAKIASMSDSTLLKLDSAKHKALAGAQGRDDSAAIERAFMVANAPFMKASQIADTLGSVVKKSKLRKLGAKLSKQRDTLYTSVAQYDSAQRALPADERDGWWERIMQHRAIEVRRKYKGNDEEMMKELLEKFMHTFPYLLFVSLPLYALYLKLLYIRRNQFLYVNHGLFLIYLYIFTFILLLLFFGVMKLKETTDWDWLGWLQAILLLYGVYYAYKAMRKYYGQGRLKTFVKFCILNTFAFFTVTVLFVVFFLFVMYKV